MNFWGQIKVSPSSGCRGGSMVVYASYSVQIVHPIVIASITCVESMDQAGDRERAGCSYAQVAWSI